MRKRILQKLSTEMKETKRLFKEKITTLMLGGFGLVAALAWNEAIKSLFEFYLPAKKEITGKFLYAVLVTFIVVMISRYLEKISEKSAEEKKQ